MKDIHADKILILDFGSQYTQLIARRVRELGTFSEIHPWDISLERIKAFNAKGIILSGGPESVTLENTPTISKEVLGLGIPVLGICYGMQAIAKQMEGEVEESDHKEFGYAQVNVGNDSELLSGLSDQTNTDAKAVLDVWMSHGDRVAKLPSGFKIIASTDSAPIAAIENKDKKLFGLQFHPEVTHTKQGAKILARFVHDICACNSDWTSENIVNESIENIKQQVGDDHVVLGLSGGVDSSVVAALLHKAIGAQLTCIFVDTGLLRLNEGDQVMETFAQHMGVKVIRVNAEQRYLESLKDETDPEKKRKIIGNLFVKIFEEESEKLSDAKWLAQGTIYPDVIESAGNKDGKAKVIKSHHNVGGLPERMHLKLIEPLRELFKDEVREIGLHLGLPAHLIHRHPFPGPGLAVRILGEVRREYADVLREADAIFIEELRNHNLYDKVSQAFAVYLPVKSVGVVGDARRYEHVIALRAVETIDFMTA
ncbi:MAG: glutamine-hydrolyzing GMP synthase, partial [Gammaproteobacteria bacterium]